VGAAEDGDTANSRRSTAGAKPNDAVDDADNVCLPLFVIPQRFGALLGNFKCYQHRYAVFCYRVGRFIEVSGGEADRKR